MLKFNYTKISNKGNLIIVWDSEQDKVVKGYVTKQTYTEFKEKVRKDLGDVAEHWQMDKLFAIHPDILSSMIPGIDKDVRHPEENSIRPIKEVIISLNDDYKWTRERIADWLDTLDEQPKFKLGD